MWAMRAAGVLTCVLAGPRAAEAGPGRRERARLREWAVRVCLGRAGERVRESWAGHWAEMVWGLGSFCSSISFPLLTQTTQTKAIRIETKI